MSENNTDTNDTTEDLGVDDNEAQQLLADALESDTDTETDTDDSAAQIQQLTADLNRWKTLARKHEGRAKENAGAAAKAKSVQDQIAELRDQLSERDTKLQEESEKRLTANKKRALTQVYAELADAGLKKTDVREILEGYDPSVLLKDGEPNDDAITKLAKSLAKVAGRVQPDQDQGRKGGTAPPNMNELIRRAAGITL